jgi:hypothetical protein
MGRRILCKCPVGAPDGEQPTPVVAAIEVKRKARRVRRRETGSFPGCDSNIEAAPLRRACGTQNARKGYATLSTMDAEGIL